MEESIEIGALYQVDYDNHRDNCVIKVVDIRNKQDFDLGRVFFGLILLQNNSDGKSVGRIFPFLKDNINRTMTKL